MPAGNAGLAEHRRNFGDETKIVWTMRHPIDVGLSWIERFRTPERLQKELSLYGPVKAHGPSPIQKLSDVMSVYKREALRVHTALQKMPNRVHICHYENMVEHPKEAARSLFKFLEEPFAESLVDDLFKTRRQIIGGDPKFNQTQKINTNSKGRWWSFATEHSADFTTVVRDCKVRESMQFLGYESELQELQPFLGG